MIAALLLACWLVMAAAPATPLGRALRRGLVDAPARWLDQITRRHVVGAAIVTVIAMAAFVMGGDAIPVAGLSMPEVVSFLAMVDVASLAEVALLAVLTLPWMRKIARGVPIAALLPVAMIRRTRPRARRPRRASPANDEDSRHAVLLAA